jgi:uncharacterized protein (TIGR02270 family)
MSQSTVIVPEIVGQHAEETASLFAIRAAVTDAPHLRLADLQRLDDRIAAHLDGLSVAGVDAWPFCESALEMPTAGSVFTAAVWALQNDPSTLDQLVTLCRTDRMIFGGLTSAFGWVEPARLEGIVAKLLVHPEPIEREIGIAACAAHRVDPGPGFRGWLTDSDAAVRARALRAAGEIGRNDLVSSCLSALTDADEECRFWAAWSAVLLGDRQRATGYLLREATARSRHKARAFRLVLQALGVSAGHEILRGLARNPNQLEWVIHGSGLVGDVSYVAWLINHFRQEETSRLAGEAFSLVTGLDLTQAELWRQAPASVDTGPGDDPRDDDVDIAWDEGLPSPDPERVQRWWDVNSPRLEPGVRYFMGAPVTHEHCMDVLKSGYQRQRILAAHYLSLLNPGAPLFNTSAPARRQALSLARMQ